MDNKHVGWIIIGMAALMIIIVFLYSAALKDIVSSSCTAVGHGDSCPMYETITKQIDKELGREKTIERIAQERHEIGNHSYEHKSLWFIITFLPLLIYLYFSWDILMVDVYLKI